MAELPDHLELMQITELHRARREQQKAALKPLDPAQADRWSKFLAYQKCVESIYAGKIDMNACQELYDDVYEEAPIPSFFLLL